MSTVPTQHMVSATFGAMLAGILIQQLLLGSIINQAYNYYYRFHDRDSMFYQYLVAVLLTFNALQLAMDMDVIYRTAVTHYGQYEFFDLQTWTMWAEPGITKLPPWQAVVGLLAQLFFMERCWSLTDRSRPVLAVLSISMLFSLGSGIAVSICFFQARLFSELVKIPIPISLWLISTAVTDLAIAGILCRTLHRVCTSFKHTKSVLTKLIMLSLETSLCTAVCAILNLILYFVKMSTAYHLIPQFSICRVYTITVLFTLLQRDALRDELDGQTSVPFSICEIPQDRPMPKIIPDDPQSIKESGSWTPHMSA
ncbi:hypothetical protein B0H13DRAFT_2306423 [Mycena leptocephala]|nr:hypothetical protein B0H13DRAFT_2306423 [Mycena leptocephala]